MHNLKWTAMQIFYWSFCKHVSGVCYPLRFTCMAVQIWHSRSTILPLIMPLESSLNKIRRRTNETDNPTLKACHLICQNGDASVSGCFNGRACSLDSIWKLPPWHLPDVRIGGQQLPKIFVHFWHRQSDKHVQFIQRWARCVEVWRWEGSELLSHALFLFLSSH